MVPTKNDHALSMMLTATKPFTASGIASAASIPSGSASSLISYLVMAKVLGIAGMDGASQSYVVVRTGLTPEKARLLMRRAKSRHDAKTKRRPSRRGVTVARRGPAPVMTATSAAGMAAAIAEWQRKAEALDTIVEAIKRAGYTIEPAG